MSGASLPRAAARYKATQVATCSPGDLLLLLIDGAIRFAAEADQAMARRGVLEDFLRQGAGESAPFEETLAKLLGVAA